MQEHAAAEGRSGVIKKLRGRTKGCNNYLGNPSGTKWKPKTYCFNIGDNTDKILSFIFVFTVSFTVLSFIKNVLDLRKYGNGDYCILWTFCTLGQQCFLRTEVQSRLNF